MRSEGEEREMAGSSKMERTLRVITKSKSILTILLGEFMRAWLHTYVCGGVLNFFSYYAVHSKTGYVLCINIVAGDKQKSSFNLTCVLWSLPVGSLIAQNVDNQRHAHTHPIENSLISL
jgi:hypothetical protein